jgi:hypothetical protein
MNMGSDRSPFRVTALLCSPEIPTRRHAFLASSTGLEIAGQRTQETNSGA